MSSYFIWTCHKNQALIQWAKALRLKLKPTSKMCSDIKQQSARCTFKAARSKLTALGVLQGVHARPYTFNSVVFCNFYEMKETQICSRSFESASSDWHVRVKHRTAHFLSLQADCSFKWKKFKWFEFSIRLGQRLSPHSVFMQPSILMHFPNAA